MRMEKTFATVSAAGLEYKIREHRIADLGLQIWPGGQLLLEWLARLRDWHDVHVLEIGAGTGLLAVGLAKLGAHVYATDYDTDTLNNLQFNVQRNAVSDNVTVLKWDWKDKPPVQLPFENIEYCVGSDVAYCGTVHNVSNAVAALKACKPELEIYLTLQDRGNNAVRGFVECCTKRGLEVLMKKPPVLAPVGNIETALVFDDLENGDPNLVLESGTLASPSAAYIAKILEIGREEPLDYLSEGSISI